MQRAARLPWKPLYSCRKITALLYTFHQLKSNGLQSPFNLQFIFKGGLFLAHYISIGRETRDIDFLNRALPPNEEKVRNTFEQILATPATDGFIFSLTKVEQLNQPHMPHPGFRLKIFVTYGSISDHVFVDLGTGDDVTPIQDQFDLAG